MPDGSDVGEISLLRVAQVAQQSARSADGRLLALQTEPLEAADAKLVQQRLPRGLEIEVPAFDLGDRQSQRA